jgi:hypothetical protein
MVTVSVAEVMKLVVSTDLQLGCNFDLGCDRDIFKDICQLGAMDDVFLSSWSTSGGVCIIKQQLL